MKPIRLRRPAVMVGLAGLALGAAMLVPSAASADVPNPPLGQFAGGLTFSPASGSSAVDPTFTAAHACPTGTANATISVIDTSSNEQAVSNPVDGAAATTPGFQGSLLAGTMSLLPVFAGGTLPASYEFVVDCHAQAGVPGTLTDYVIINMAADGSWQVQGSVQQPTPTTTTLSAPSNVPSGGNVTLNATVSPAAAAGTVQFKDGTANLGAAVAVTSGTAQFSTTTLADGPHPITAVFTPTDATAFGASTSSGVTVNVGGITGTETINVNVPQSEGAFVLTVSATAVNLTDAVLNAAGTVFQSTGSLSPVTVSDGRNQSKPGWRVSGQVSDFVNGALVIDGNSLGWTPAITTPNAANDVVAGPAVTAGSNPGLKQGSGLASAAVAKGLGTTVLGGGLDLQVPASTTAGHYTATLTITAIPAA